MDALVYSKSSKAKTGQSNLILSGLLTLALMLLSMCGNPHTPVSQTWEVISQIGDVVWSIASRTDAPLLTWWPILYPDLCKLPIGTPAPWDIKGYSDTSRPPTG